MCWYCWVHFIHTDFGELWVNTQMSHNIKTTDGWCKWHWTKKPWLRMWMLFNPEHAPKLCCSQVITPYGQHSLSHKFKAHHRFGCEAFLGQVQILSSSTGCPHEPFLWCGSTQCDAGGPVHQCVSVPVPWGVWRRWHEYQDPRFPSRIWDCKEMVSDSDFHFQWF